MLAAYGEHTAPNTPLAQQKNPIAQFTFDDEETGYTSDLAVAGIHGTAKLEDGNNGTKAARLGSGSWLSVTQTNGAALLLDATEFTVSYDAKPDSQRQYRLDLLRGSVHGCPDVQPIRTLHRSA